MTGILLKNFVIDNNRTIPKGTRVKILKEHEGYITFEFNVLNTRNRWNCFPHNIKIDQLSKYGSKKKDSINQP